MSGRPLPALATQAPVWFRRQASSFFMPASLGGSVVDPSLLRQASDRGVTIAFADLDGAEGLWVPEERTVLVSRKLTESEVARVIEHELTHVMIDDQHADLDAGKDVLVGHPPVRSRRWAAAALTAAGLLAVVGGVTFGIAKATGGPPKEQLAPTRPGLTASESGQAPGPGLIVVPSRGPDGQIVYVTVRAPAPAAPRPSTTASPLGTVAGTATAPLPVPKPTASVLPPAGTPSASPPPVVVSSDPPTIDPTTDPPTTPAGPPPTSPAGVSDPPDGGQSGGAPGDVVGGGDVASEPGGVGASDVAVAGSGGVDPGVAPTG